MIKILCFVGARPNFMKIAPIFEEMKKYPGKIKPVLVHTGQHYDFEMSKSFFKDLNIPTPDYNLAVGSGSHGEQVGKGLIRAERLLLAGKTDLVLVVGDSNACLVGSLAAAKLHIPVAHIEAGLRSFDMNMAEEINRILTDRISDYLFITEPSAKTNLLKEGISSSKIFFVGNVMIDSLIKSLSQIKKSQILKKLRLEQKKYALLTLHRAENVDNKERMGKLISIIDKIQKKLKIVYPCHPRTKERIVKFGFLGRINKMKNLKIIEPLGYLEFSNLELNSKFVLTDSGGVQEEASFLHVPCLTFRDNTERPITVSEGTNIICGIDGKKVMKEVAKILIEKGKHGGRIKYWDGIASKRIVSLLIKMLAG